MPTKNIRPAWDAGYFILNDHAPKRVALLLHGFQQTGEFMGRVLQDCFDADTLVLAPNAPFPMPYKPGKAPLRMGYTWYIYDQETDRYLVPMDQAIACVTELIKALGYQHLPTKILGFSQGGYIAPFLAKELSSVSQIVGINSRYRSEAIKEVFPFRTDAVQAMNDTMVDPERAKRCHQEVIALGNTGVFHEVKDSGHMFNSRLINGLREVLALV